MTVGAHIGGLAVEHHAQGLARHHAQPRAELRARVEQQTHHSTRVVGHRIRQRRVVLNAEVGRRIREQRHACALTLKQLANRTGLSVSLISQIELGKSAASLSTLRRLSAALAVRMSFFFETG